MQILTTEVVKDCIVYALLVIQRNAKLLGRSQGKMNFLYHSFLFGFTTPPSVNQMIYIIYSLNGLHLFFFSLITKKE